MIKRLIFTAMIFSGSFGFAQNGPSKPYVPTAEELKIIKKARAEFKKAKKLPPPSQNMQNKMQSADQDVGFVSTSTPATLKKNNEGISE